MSGCSRCADCLSEVSMSLAAVLGPPGTASLDASRISLAFRIWCSTKGIEASVCGRVATAIAFSAAGNLAKRPGDCTGQHNTAQPLGKSARQV